MSDPRADLYLDVCPCTDPDCPDYFVAHLARRPKGKWDDVTVEEADGDEADARADGWWGERVAMMERRAG